MKSNFKVSDSETFFYQFHISLDAELSLSTEEGFIPDIFYERDLLSDRNLSVYKASRVQDYFIYESGRFLSALNKDNSLVEFAAGKYRLIKKDGTAWLFCDPSSCKVTGIYTPDGKQLFFGYSSNKQLTSIKNFHGFNISLTWSNGQIAEITETIYPFQK